MDEPDLLTRRACAWADQSERPVDPVVLRAVLTLRADYEEPDAGQWPPGSVERLLLVTWPAHGPPPPDLAALGSTLDTFWDYLRVTGQMSEWSAKPARLRKELKRALPRLPDAYAARARPSSSQFLADFGRSIGIDIDRAADVVDLQDRLDRIRAAWDARPVPEPIEPATETTAETGTETPTGPRSRTDEEWAALIEAVRAGTADPEAPPYDEHLTVRQGELRESATLARGSGFVRSCLALADWVGEGRPATARGLLRVAVAREAYRELDLWPWQRALESTRSASYGVALEELPPEADARRAEAAAQSWRSARDCLPLDRLWSACEATGLVEVGPKLARRTAAAPTLDEEWRNLAVALLLALCRRLGHDLIEPLAGMLLIPQATPEEAVPLAAVRAWWDSLRPEYLSDDPLHHWQGRLDLLHFHLEDGNLWRIDGDRIALTDLGHDFAIAYLRAVNEGFFGGD